MKMMKNTDEQPEQKDDKNLKERIKNLIEIYKKLIKE